MMQNSHILKDFEEAISGLRGEVLSMAGKARHNLERAVQALLTRNVDLANAVIADDSEVDDLELKIDKMGMEVLVRFHPMATDLRTVVSSMKISNNLERISDHATSIAKRARKISGSEELQETKLIEPIYILADQLLSDAVKAFSEGDSDLGASLNERDDELDKMHKKATRTFAECIGQNADRSKDYLHLIFCTRSLERVGDLAVNVGEDAVFLEDAKDIRHGGDRS